MSSIQKIGYSGLAALLFIPAIVSAQATSISCPDTGQTLCSLINTVIGYANQVLELMMGVAIIMFVYYVIHYYIKIDSDRTEGNKYVMYSLIGFFVILSFWGLVNILQNTFGLKNTTYQKGGWDSFMQIFPSNSGQNSGRNGAQ